MKIHQVKHCCCGCSLEAGTDMIAWLELVTGIIYIAFGMGMIITDNKTLIIGFWVAYAVLGILHTILGLLLMVGSSNKCEHLLNVWMTIQLVYVGLLAICFIILMILMMAVGRFDIGLSVLVSSLIGSLISYYCIMVVSSFRSEIMSGNNGV